MHEYMTFESMTSVKRYKPSAFGKDV